MNSATSRVIEQVLDMTFFSQYLLHFVLAVDIYSPWFILQDWARCKISYKHPATRGLSRSEHLLCAVLTAVDQLQAARLDTLT